MTSVSSTFTAPSPAAPLTGTVAPRFARQPATMETMSTRVIDHVTDLADQLRDQAWEAEKIGKLTDDTVKTMKAAGNIRMLQPAEHGGLEVHPREFAETVMALAALDPSAGWVNGVVGVHPYQLAYADPRVATEIWADDVDIWVASPYAPQGIATQGHLRSA